LGEVVIAAKAKGKGCVVRRTGLKTQAGLKYKPSSSMVFGLYPLGFGELREREENYKNDTCIDQLSLFHKQSSLYNPSQIEKILRFVSRPSAIPRMISGR
jgi:hypothetical protein